MTTRQPPRRPFIAFGIGITFLATTLIFAPTAAAVETSVVCPTEPTPVSTEQTDALFALAADRLYAAANVANLGKPSIKYPFGATARQTQYLRSDAYGWTAGFYPAELWMMYERTADPAWLALARSWTKGLLSVAKWTGSHDLGFMIGLPAGLGMRLDPDLSQRVIYRRAIIDAAKSLSTRWNNKVKAIKSGEYIGKWGLIIDSAMNAPMLIEAGNMIGGAEGAQLRSRGEQHLLTLAKFFVRSNGSTFHRLTFDPKTGAYLGPVYGQGYNMSTSTWSRGQAWAMYGFAKGYAATGNPTLLDVAQRTIGFWNQQVAPGCVPAWDLDVWSAFAPRDSSAASIAAAAMLLMADLDPVSSAEMSQRALTTLGTLTSPEWTSINTQNPGILIRQTWNVPLLKYEGSYVWGDTYLLESLMKVVSPAEPRPPFGSGGKFEATSRG